MDDKAVQALCESALKEDPRAQIQVFNITTPGTVIVIGGNYFGGGASYKKAKTSSSSSSSNESEEELIEDDEVPFDTVRREEVSMASPGIVEEVAEVDTQASRKLTGLKDELVNSFTEEVPENLWPVKLAKAGISQEILDAQGQDAVDAILDRAFPDWA